MTIFFENFIHLHLHTIFTSAGGIMAGLAAVFVAWQGIRIYKGNLKLERAKWAHKLYETFYEKPHYAPVRRKIDHEYNDPEKLKNLIGKDDFYDYLNFFEFVAFLWHCKQLTDAEVWGLLGFYLKQLKNPIIQPEIDNANWSYEHLEKLLDTI